MLRINQIQTSQGITLRLEGKLLEPWVAELRQVISRASEQHAVSLDLASVSFVDAAGAELLRELRSSGIPISACSNFIAELLKTEQA